MNLEKLCVNNISNHIINNNLDIKTLDPLNYTCKKKVLNEIRIIGKIRTVINNAISYIIDGYTILDKSIYDCDEYGYIYDVYCKNGFDGQEHDISQQEYYDKMIFIKNIVDNGIFIDDERYYVHECILFNIKNIKLISENNHKKRMEYASNILKNVNQIKNVITILSNRHSNISPTSYKYNLLYCYNQEYIYKSMYIILNFCRFSYKNINFLQDYFDTKKKIIKYSNYEWIDLLDF